MYNSITLSLFIFTLTFGLYRYGSNNVAAGLSIDVTNANGDNAELIVKGDNTFNSNNDRGMASNLVANSNLEINVENGATLNSCGNSGDDIYGFVGVGATATFLGTGYTCSSKQFINGGTVVEPVCQPCA